ncbi:hypothetical protein SASPL_142136 [Salvia splendens]|uniref:Uncharacterized protein n=2 Tax=Salvia splendens TaxID=180675 RepID=A0A8X8Z972_SALSN|nr:hypothetical protein SASPL_142136 [Salvia splendens]
MSKCEKMAAGDEAEDRVRAVSFAAGTAAFMACIERAFMVSVFMHWRVWAFLALNLLLLAILFTSKSQNTESSQIQSKNGGDEAEIKRSKKARHRQRKQLLPTSGGAAEECVVAATEEAPRAEGEVEVENGENEIEGKLDEYDELSEEELKQRVENFIAMFRQHLICDAKGAQIVGCANAIASRVY